MQKLPLLILLLSAPWGLSSCQKKGQKEPSHTPRTVKTTTTHDLRTLEKEFVGLATPDDAVNLAFKIGGQVINIPVSKGRSVRKGELIAELDPREVELEVAANRTAYEEATSQLKRMQRLLEHEAISVQEYETALTRHAQAKATYENSQTLLLDTRLRAPFPGVIESTSVDAFERVTAGQTIARLVNPYTRTVSFTMPERALYLLEEPSTHFRVRFDNYPGRTFEARLKNYARTSANASGFPTSLLVSNPDSLRYPISPGMSCTILLEAADPIQGAVSLPLSAIYAPVQGGDYVWVVNSENRTELRRVKLGAPFGSDRIVIDSGLAPDERVVTAGVYRLQAGEKVVSIQSNPR